MMRPGMSHYHAPVLQVDPDGWQHHATYTVRFTISGWIDMDDLGFYFAPM
jgi:hypothetical protein